MNSAIRAYDGIFPVNKNFQLSTRSSFTNQWLIARSKILRLTIQNRLNIWFREPKGVN